MNKSKVFLALLLCAMLAMPAFAEGDAPEATYYSIALADPQLYMNDELAVDLTGLSLSLAAIDADGIGGLLASLSAGEATFTAGADIGQDAVTLFMDGVESLYSIDKETLGAMLGEMGAGVSVNGMEDMLSMIDPEALAAEMEAWANAQMETFTALTENAEINEGVEYEMYDGVHTTTEYYVQVPGEVIAETVTSFLTAMDTALADYMAQIRALAPDMPESLAAGVGDITFPDCGYYLYIDENDPAYVSVLGHTVSDDDDAASTYMDVYMPEDGTFGLNGGINAGEATVMFGFSYDETGLFVSVAGYEGEEETSAFEMSFAVSVDEETQMPYAAFSLVGEDGEALDIYYHSNDATERLLQVSYSDSAASVSFELAGEIDITEGYAEVGTITAQMISEDQNIGFTAQYAIESATDVFAGLLPESVDMPVVDVSAMTEEENEALMAQLTNVGASILTSLTENVPGVAALMAMLSAPAEMPAE